MLQHSTAMLQRRVAQVTVAKEAQHFCSNQFKYANREVLAYSMLTWHMAFHRTAYIASQTMLNPNLRALSREAVGCSTTACPAASVLTWRGSARRLPRLRRGCVAPWPQWDAELARSDH